MQQKKIFLATISTLRTVNKKIGGVKNDTPKASMGLEIGRVIERPKLSHQWGPGGSPGANAFWHFSSVTAERFW